MEGSPILRAAIDRSHPGRRPVRRWHQSSISRTSIVCMTSPPGGSPPVERIRRPSQPITHPAYLHLPRPAQRGVHLRRRPRHRSLSRMTSVSARSTPRRSCAPRRAAPTATTSPTTAVSTRRSAPRRICRPSPTALRERGMGALVDVVPNHMGIAGGANAWWQDVLENGRTSAYAEYFDIDWRPLKEELRGKILLPVLGDHYGVVLERGELRLEYADGAFTVHYYETPPADRPADLPAHPVRSRLPELEADAAGRRSRAAGVPEHHHRLRAAATPGRARSRSHRRAAARAGRRQTPPG